MIGTKKGASPESDARRKYNNSSIAPKHRRVNARLVRCIAEFAFHLLLAFLGAFAVASWAVPAAYAERGYSAVGGEWLLVAVTFIAVFWLCEVVNGTD